MVTLASFSRIAVLVGALVLTLLASVLVNGHVAFGVGSVFAAPAPCDSSAGTGFFETAGHAREFRVGDAWQGGTFTFIKNGHLMRVRQQSTGDLVGRFPLSLGDQATIKFDRTIRITAVYWWDNDPEPGETGWSFNGVAGPRTGSKTGICTLVNMTTDTVMISAGGDSGGIDFWFAEVRTLTGAGPSTGAAASPPVTTGGVAPATFRPDVTLPPTDASDGIQGAQPNGLPMVFTGMLLVSLATILWRRPRDKIRGN
jgi:hypothetical protein